MDTDDESLLRPINGPAAPNSPGCCGRWRLMWSRQPLSVRTAALGAAAGVFIVLLGVLIFILMETTQPPPPCADSDCKYAVVESIPYGINKTLVTPNTIADALCELARVAEHTIDISAFYITLNRDDYGSQGTHLGRAVYQALSDAGLKRGVKIRMAVNKPDPTSADYDDYMTDLIALNESGAAEIRLVDMSRLFGGVLHTKFLIVDGSAFFVGSANMDWRSLAQVKELGIHVWNCPCLATDLTKVFEAYWEIGDHGGRQAVVPPAWPPALRTAINEATPASVDMNGELSSAYMCSAPLPLCAGGRSYDRDCLVDVIDSAQRYVLVEVMDYLPTTLYTDPQEYWPYLDDALRAADMRGVSVYFMGALWNHTKPPMLDYLRSLEQLPNIHVRMFQVPDPSGGVSIPYTRVNHAKFVASESVVAIGTSNWSGDYFIDTAGVSFVARHKMLLHDVQNRFWRDWESPFATPMNATWPVMETRLKHAHAAPMLI